MKIRKYFNMIEIVLALGVIAIGFVSILALFPVGLNASRDAVAESYSAHSADQFVHYFVNELKKSQANWDNFKVLSKPLVTDPEPSWQTTPVNNTNLYLPDPATPDSRFYKIIQKAAGGDVVDFSGIYRVWPLDVPDINNKSLAMQICIEVSWPAELTYDKRNTSMYYREVFNPNYTAP